jgi:hypothetical protein
MNMGQILRLPPGYARGTEQEHCRLEGRAHERPTSRPVQRARQQTTTPGEQESIHNQLVEEAVLRGWLTSATRCLDPRQFRAMERGEFLLHEQRREKEPNRGAWGFTDKTALLGHQTGKGGAPHGRGGEFLLRPITEIILFGVRGKNTPARDGPTSGQFPGYVQK